MSTPEECALAAAWLADQWPNQNKLREGMGVFQTCAGKTGLGLMLSRAKEYLAIAKHDPDGGLYAKSFSSWCEIAGRSGLADWQAKMEGWIVYFKDPKFLADDELPWDEVMKEEFGRVGKKIRAFPDCRLRDIALSALETAWITRGSMTLGKSLGALRDEMEAVLGDMHAGGEDNSEKYAAYYFVHDVMERIIKTARKKGCGRSEA